jgi:DNA-binding transcriptional ArsR family regulator
MDYRRDPFQAIADPTRRQIIDLVATRPMNLNAIAENFDVSRQAISLHIRILEECGLLSITQRGRERFCSSRPERLSEVAVWVEKYRQHFEQKLDALENYLDTLKKKEKNVKRKK